MADTPGKWQQLKGLGAWQWKVLLLTPFILLLTWVRLRSSGYGQTLRKAQPTSASQLSAEDQLALAKETAYAVAVAIKYGPWRPLCLLRSLTLGWFLGRKGIPYKVQIGVPGGKFDFSAHAWVEFEGVVLNDKDDVADEFVPFVDRE